jgi:copper chaperone
MPVFEVQDMSCGHCVATITAAVKALDREAEVQTDLATHTVQIVSAVADGPALARAIEQAGYTPLALGAASSPGAAGDS